MRLSSSSSKGFTLIELMIVVVIIGVLSAVAVPAYFNHVLRTRQANGVKKLLDIKTTQEKYYAINDEYAASMATTGFSSLLSFDSADTQFYTFTTVGTTTTFTAQINGNNTTMLNQDCWQLNQSWANPSTCGEPVGFSFSNLADLFR